VVLGGRAVSKALGGLIGGKMEETEEMAAMAAVRKRKRPGLGEVLLKGRVVIDNEVE
jgi:hypothetical protein